MQRPTAVACFEARRFAPRPSDWGDWRCPDDRQPRAGRVVILRQVVHGDRRAALRKKLDGRKPDAGRAAGDEDGLAGKVCADHLLSFPQPEFRAILPSPHPEVRAEGEPRRTQPCRRSAPPPLRASRIAPLAPQHEESGDAPTILSPAPGARLSCGRWFIAMVAPHCANSSTAASPMPHEPPVTRTVLPMRSAEIIAFPSMRAGAVLPAPHAEVRAERASKDATLPTRHPTAVACFEARRFAPRTSA